MEENRVKEVCPGCKAPMNWDAEMDWYCVGNQPGIINRTELSRLVPGVESSDVEVHTCPHCGSVLAVTLCTYKGQDTFINADAIPGLEI